MDEAAVWFLEERLWREGAEAFRTLTDPECVMAFAAPVGLLKGEAILRMLEGAPRWKSIAMTEKVARTPDPATIVIGYRAEGRREGSPPYRAYCSSTYRFEDGAWRLVQHQQTPMA